MDQSCAGVRVAHRVRTKDDPRFSPAHTDPSPGRYPTTSVVPLPITSAVANRQSWPGVTVAQVPRKTNAEPVFSPTHSVPLSRWWASRSALARPVNRPQWIVHPAAGARVAHRAKAKPSPRFSPTHTAPLPGW